MGDQGLRLTDGCQDALANVIGRSPGFASRAASYGRAANEPLRWRKMFARAKTKNLLKDYPEVQSLLSSESPTINTDSPDSPPVSTVVGPRGLQREARQVMVDAAARLIGKKVSSGPALHLSSKSPLAMVPFDGQAYLAVLLSPNESEVGDLKSAVFVTETEDALAMNAANAVSSAETLDYQTMGGTILGVTLEPRLVRFATLPESGHALVPLGALPHLKDHQFFPHDAICWRIDVRASVLQNDYFVSQSNQ